MDVSKNRGTPKSSIFIGFFIINHRFWGVSPYFWFNTHIHPHVWGAQNVVAPPQVSLVDPRGGEEMAVVERQGISDSKSQRFFGCSNDVYKISIINQRFVDSIFCGIIISYFHPFFFGGGRLFCCWEMSLMESKSMCFLTKKSVAIWLRHGRYGLYWSLVQGLAVATIELQRIIP